MLTDTEFYRTRVPQSYYGRYKELNVGHHEGEEPYYWGQAKP
jgi:hypothetical protein